jgi:hypothetical protein
LNKYEILDISKLLSNSKTHYEVKGIIENFLKRINQNNNMDKDYDIKEKDYDFKIE